MTIIPINDYILVQIIEPDFIVGHGIPERRCKVLESSVSTFSKGDYIFYLSSKSVRVGTLQELVPVSAVVAKVKYE